MIAAAIAYIVFPAVAALERRLRWPRVLIVLCFYVILVGALVGPLYVFAPRLIGQATRLRGEQDDEQRHRQEHRTRLNRRVAEDVLDEERVVEEDAEHRERNERDRDVRAGERRIAEEREIEHRNPLTVLEHDERSQRDRGQREHRESDRRCPPVAIRLDQPVGERKQPDA